MDKVDLCFQRDAQARQWRGGPGLCLTCKYLSHSFALVYVPKGQHQKPWSHFLPALWNWVKLFFFTDQIIFFFFFKRFQKINIFSYSHVRIIFEFMTSWWSNWSYIYIYRLFFTAKQSKCFACFDWDPGFHGYPITPRRNSGVMISNDRAKSRRREKEGGPFFPHRARKYGVILTSSTFIEKTEHKIFFL